MALIDVSELMSDPDFVDAISVIHRAEAVSALGELVLSEQQVETVGSVQPASGDTLSRLPEALRNQDVNSFWLKGQIVSDGKCRYPDLLVFKGHRYAVQTVSDWAHWGQGWSMGVCVREKISL